MDEKPLVVENTELPTANTSLGQHWLSDESMLTAICDAAQLQPTDVVLEVGAGPGTLTKHLVKRAAQVTAVELDEHLADTLAHQQIAKNLQIVRGDILKFNLTSLPADYKVVANIPYYLTSKLLRILSESANPPSLTVLLVQKEVAQRVVAKPGTMSLLSVSAQFYWLVELGIAVPAKYFTPPPKVDSQVLIMKRRTHPLFDDVDVALFFQVVKAGFSARRKTLLNSLSGGLRLSKDETNSLLTNANIDGSMRAQNLSLEEWHQLYIAFTSLAS